MRMKRGFSEAKVYRSYTVMTDAELENYLNEIGLDKVKRVNGNRGTNFMFCCPFHGERRPSAGIINSEEGIYGQCYSCEETFSLPKLISQVLSIEFDEAVEELDGRFNSEKREVIFEDKQFDNLIMDGSRKKSQITVLPNVYLAPFRSGKTTHKYFMDRGFTKETVKECKIGWDRIKKRVTVPVFHQDGTLAGVSGRAVLEQKLPDGRMNPAYIEAYGKSPKYLLYDNFEISNILFGSHEFPEGEDTAIIVEGMFDRLYMRQLGFFNALGIIIAKMSKDRNGNSKQKEILHDLGVKNIIFMHDNDDPGRVGKEVAYEILRNDFTCYDVEYPRGYTDVLGDEELPPLSRKQVDEMLSKKTIYGEVDFSELLMK